MRISKSHSEWVLLSFVFFFISDSLSERLELKSGEPDLLLNTPKTKTVKDCEIPSSTELFQCLRCEFGFILSIDGNRCLATKNLIESEDGRLDNCLQIGMFNECILCECGFSMIRRMNVCLPTPEPTLHGCQIIDGDTCVKPKKEFSIVLSNQGEPPLSSTHPQYSAQVPAIEFSQGTNCEIKTQFDECVRCHSGYKLTSLNTCVQVPYRISNSYYSYFEGDELKSNDIRLIALKNIGVFQIIDHCIEYAPAPARSEITCISCTKGRILNESKTNCFKSPQDLCISVSNDDPSICLECERHYYMLHIPFKGTQCVPRKTHAYNGCLIYSNSEDSCEKCRYPFVLSSTRKCRMKSDSFLNRRRESADYHRNFQFAEPIPNCYFHSPQPGICIECHPEYKLQKGGRICEKIQDEYCSLFDMNKRCIKCPTDQPFNYVLEKCASNVNIISSQHDFDIMKCIEFDQFSGRCLACFPGLWLDEPGNQCLQLFQCKVSNGVDKECLVCKNLYYLSQFKIHSDEPPSCSYISNVKGCFLSDGKTNSCLTCVKNYRMDVETNVCIPFVQHNNISCHLFGFYIVRMEDPYCAEHSIQVTENCFMLDSKSNRCIRCNLSFYLDEHSGRCISIPDCQIAAEGKINVCLLTSFDHNHLNESGQVVESKCPTNRRNDICLRVDSNGGIIVSRLIEAGKIIVDFDSEAFFASFGLKVSKILEKCFVIERFPTQKQQSEQQPVLHQNKYFYRCLQCLSLYYITEEGTCERLKSLYCELSDGINNVCLACSKISTLNENTGKCEGILKDSNISHCVKYNRRVEDENEHSQIRKCLKCENLFYLNFDGYLCVSISNPNCQYSDGILDRCHSLKVAPFQSDPQDYHFCEIIDPKSQMCSKCFLGYSLLLINNTSACVSTKDMNCERIVEGSHCERCVEGYYKNLLEWNESINRRNRYFYNENISIEFCSRITKPNCLQMIDNTRSCSQCREGYFLSPSGNCVKIEHCKTFDTKCRTCDEPYFVNSLGVCEMIQFCAKSSRNQCDSCNSTFYLSDSKHMCLPIPNCAASFGRDFTCQLCIPLFTLIAGRCIPNNPVPNCVTYSQSEPKCLKCRTLFYLQAKSENDDTSAFPLCVPISMNEFCNFSDGITNECLICEKTGYAFLERKRDQESIDVNPQKKCELIPNCVISNGIDACYFCSKFYYLNKITKSIHNSKNKLASVLCLARNLIQFCEFYASSEDVCEQCESLFYLSEDRKRCNAMISEDDAKVQIIDKTANSLENSPKKNGCFLSEGILNECMICMNSNKFIAYNGRIQLNNFRVNFQEVNVKDCNQIVKLNEINTHCSINFYFSTKCVPRWENQAEITADSRTNNLTTNPSQNQLDYFEEFNDDFENCSTYYPDRSGCRTCNSGYVLILIGKDTNIEKGDALPYGSYCSAIPTSDLVENCERYEANSNLCQKCKQSEQLDILEFKLDTATNTCRDILAQQCARNSRENSCTYQPIQFCIEYQDQSQERKRDQEYICLTCMNGYYLKKNICERHPYIHGCAEYNPTMRNVCESCVQGFFRMGTLCEEVLDLYCDLNYYYSQKCTQCVEGYAIDSIQLVCKKTDLANCAQMSFERNLQKNVCLRCKKNYEFDQSHNCVKQNRSLDTNCLTASSTNVCQKCKPGYFINKENACLKLNSVCSINNCAAYQINSMPDSYYCQKCTIDFESESPQQCIPSNSHGTKDSNNSENKDQMTNDEDAASDNEEKNSENAESQGTDVIGIVAVLGCCSLIIFVLIILYFISKKNVQLIAESSSDSNQILNQSNQNPITFETKCDIELVD